MLNRLRKRLLRRPNTGDYSPEKVEERWSRIAPMCDFRPTDTVLDIGSAEGVVSLEVAPLVAHVHGVEFYRHKVKNAKAEAKRRGITNATFEQASVLDYEPDPYDVVLLLSVLNKTDDRGQIVGLDVLGKLLAATKRQIIVRNSGGFALRDIKALFAKHDFDCQYKLKKPDYSNRIIGNRQR